MRKVIKVFTVVYTCILIIVFGSSPAFAASDETILYGMTHEQMLQYGFIYDNGSYSLPSGIIPPDAYFPSTMESLEKNFIDFDPNKLPWIDAPSAVKDVLNMGTDGVVYGSDFKNTCMPFVFIRANSSNIRVFVGVNCSIGRINNTGNIRIVTASSSKFAWSLPSYCYTALFNYNYECTSPWTQLSPQIWGDTGKVLSFSTGTVLAESFIVDIYLYGGNCIRGPMVSGDDGLIQTVTTVTIAASDSANVVVFQNLDTGFNSGRYIPEIQLYPGVYFETFVPEVFGKVDNSSQNKLSAAEDALFASNYNPDNFLNDFTVTLDGSAINAVFAVMDAFVQIDSTVFGALLIALTLGVIALIFGR